MCRSSYRSRRSHHLGLVHRLRCILGCLRLDHGKLLLLLLRLVWSQLVANAISLVMVTLKSAHQSSVRAQ